MIVDGIVSGPGLHTEKNPPHAHIGIPDMGCAVRGPGHSARIERGASVNRSYVPDI
jgi:hypothetical protein